MVTRPPYGDGASLTVPTRRRRKLLAGWLVDLDGPAIGLTVSVVLMTSRRFRLCYPDGAAGWYVRPKCGLVLMLKVAPKEGGGA
jgi:hypothetical protein